MELVYDSTRSEIQMINNVIPSQRYNFAGTLFGVGQKPCDNVIGLTMTMTMTMP